MAGQSEPGETAETAAVRSNPPPGPRAHPITLLLIAQAIGITAGWEQGRPRIWPWIIGAMASLVIAACAKAHWRRLRLAAMCFTMLCLSAGWLTLTQQYVAPDDLAAYVGDRQMLVKLEGVALRPPVLKARTAGSMAKFDYRPPASYFPMRVEHVSPDGAEARPVHGQVLVRIDEVVSPFRAGDRVEVTGMLLRPAEPRNPGEFNYREYAKSIGQAGVLTVESRGLMMVTSSARGSLQAAYLDWRDTLRRRAGAWLLADLPESDRAPRDALLANLMLGERDEQIDAVYESFRRVGLAHILAISGFHLSVLAASVLGLARLLGGFRRWHALLVIGVVLAYLFLIEVHMPVLRAAVMTIAASLGLLGGRRLRAAGLVALSAIILLFWRPDQLFNPGFQLTFGVVLALIHLSPPVRSRWFGMPRQEASTVGEMLGEWLKTALAVSVVAWLVATPIAMFHFGVVSPLGILMSLIAVPLSALILALGFAKIILSAVLPSVALLVGVPLSISADMLLSIVMTVDRVPGSLVHVPFPDAAWSIAGALWVCWWAANPMRRWQWRHWIVLSALMVWLFWPWLPVHRRPTLRIDMLSVGDGSCYVLRSGGKTVVFDAGSSTDLAVGARSLIPAMRRLDVRSIDAIAVSHADLDHYSAVLELADEFSVGEVLLTPQFLAEARALPGGPTAFLVDELTRRRISLHPTARGETRTFGESDWAWLNPEADKDYAKTNDSSMVIRIQAAGRHAMMCGDIQTDTENALMHMGIDLTADILELPHHGSFPRGAERFVRTVHPGIVMQSTGWKRFSTDKWAAELAGSDRLVTIRDGACWVEVAADGAITNGTFIQGSN